MRKILCIGGRCEACGGHVALKVSSSIDTFKFGLVFYLIGFTCGALGTYFWLH